ncbi:MAG: class I SAM-dependent methyltransferase [Alphaproteobacteria bacterium]|nr:class I SAM-dependent methyltransferase [Alphaproteobacteria bacterium]
MSATFAPCEICGANAWTPVYRGPVRDGRFGKAFADATVGRCGGCGVDRLEERACFDDSLYEGEAYREALGEATDVAGFMAEHDALQRHRLDFVWPRFRRGGRIADIGAAAGGFLDHLAGLAAESVAVEPCAVYHDDLRKRGYRVYPYATDAARDYAGKIDFAFNLGVIEHVPDPRGLLADIAKLLAPRGLALVATANRDTLLMKIQPGEFPAFFYRRVHRWYWNRASFEMLVARAGLKLIEYRCGHRFGLSNSLIWLRDRRPGGEAALPGLDSAALDAAWKAHLEGTNQGDQIYFWLARA